MHSPLTGAPALYCRWSVRRRLLARGQDDEVRGEVAAEFVIELPDEQRSVDLDTIILHLSGKRGEAWSAWWEGLRPELRTQLTREFPNELPGARYHCEHVLLDPDAPVTLLDRPALLTDLAPSEAAVWARRIAVARFLPAAVLGGIGVLGLVI